MANLVGQTIGVYQIVERLGRGGMADVYKAFHPGLATHRALKVIRPEFGAEEGFRERFQREAQAVAALRHPNIVQMHDFGVQDNLYYMVMEFIEGRDLKSFLAEEGQLRPFSRVAAIIEQVGAALGYAHERGLIHRDIKPANIMLTPTGQAILMDFGIAKMLTLTEQMTQTGVGIGTPAYMSPEQARGLPDITPASDLYSLGIVLYEMLTGRVPFSADTPMAVMYKTINDPLPPPRDFSPDIPDVLQGVVLKATLKEPAQRYQTAAALVDGLNRSLAHAPGAPIPADLQPPAPPAPTVAAPPPPAAARAPKTPWLVSGGIAALLACLLLVAGGAGLYFWLQPAPSLATWQFVIDASEGMAGTLGDRPKMEIARAALAEELKILPENVNAGLRIFGGSAAPAEPCRDTALLVEPATGQTGQLAAKLAEITPAGEAPLTEAIVQAIGDFDLTRANKNTLIIITAGLDTCEANAVEQLDTLSRRLGIELDLQLIGLGVASAGDRVQLEEMAQAAGGSYHDAQNEDDIRQVVAQELSQLTGAATPTPLPLPTATVAPSPTPAPTLAPLPSPTATAAPAPAPAAELSAPANLSDNPGQSDSADVLFDGAGTLHMVWRDNTLRSGSGFDILARQLSPAGDWSEAANLSEGFDLISVLPPKLARRPDGSVCAFWHGARVSRDPGTIGLYMRCRAGEGWSEAEQVESRQVTARYDPKFTAAGALVSLYEVPPSSVKFADTELADGFKTINGVALAVDQAGAFHAVWVRQGDPFSLEHRLSSDGGQSWSDPASLTDEATKPNGPFNLLADEQGNVHLVWAGFGKIFYRRWTPADGWGEVSELTGGQPGSGSTSLGLAVDSQGLAHVAWQGQNFSYAQQQPDGRWSAPQILAEALNSGPGPKVAVDAEGRRHFVWQVEDDAVDLYYATLPPE